ncbi:hypothetical protein [Variovorax sp. J2P1-31]|uniref:hypothetical protein n=2 Tax=unclassified Variovorax TaxID=663243 RepID=UPI002574D45B|nr:hypothetical protein [Variovorax sp. J2P1-31]MDM0145533.1 hypothetical protein [Variovorax sp. J2P1-31]
MMLKSLGWVVLLLFAGLAVLVLATLAWMTALGWAAGLLAMVWGSFLLAEWRRWLRLRDLAWAAGAGYGIGVIRWLEVPLDETSLVLRWLVMAGYALCLLCFVWIVPALLGGVVQRLRPPELPVEKPATPEQLRRWNPRD